MTWHFPLGQFARQVGQLRREAQERDGKKSGMDLAWKQTANTMYGVLCCKHLPTSNYVAANVITAHARAEAFAVGQALNCIQTITDGCTYRRDQIPAVPFAECLKIMPEYTVRRAEDGDGIPFLDPTDVPGDDAGFTAWLHSRLRWFFGVEDEGYDSFFGTHSFEHKKTGDDGPVAFDALGCDGAGGYLKCVRDQEGNWRVEDFAARSFGKDSKKLLSDWLMQAYSTDTLEGPAPLAQDTELLSFERARQKARKLLARGMARAVFPLRFEWLKPANYRILKLSAFVFRTPAQRTAWLKAIHKFEKRTGAGLEVLGLRRNYKDRRRGSLAIVAEEVYKLVMAGEMNPGRALNLARRAKAVEAVCSPRLAELDAMKRRADHDFALAVDARRAAGSTGYLVDADALGVDVRRRSACGRLRMAEMAGSGKG